MSGTLQEQLDKLRSAYEAQRTVVSRQEQTIQNLRQENEALRQRLNEPAARPPESAPVQEQQAQLPTNSDEELSIEDLLQEADENLGSSGSTTPTSEDTAPRTTLGLWDFELSGTKGTLEFYRQNQKLLSKIQVEGDSRVTIDELIRRKDRFDVKNSATAEYYILVSSGNLEAYDQSGYLTTCVRRR